MPDVTAALATEASLTRRAKAARRVRMWQLYPDRVHLISYGPAIAIPAGDLRPGDTLLYNYGDQAQILRVAPKGRQSVTVTTSEGPYGSRTYRRATLVPIADRPSENLPHHVPITVGARVQLDGPPRPGAPTGQYGTVVNLYGDPTSPHAVVGIHWDGALPHCAGDAGTVPDPTPVAEIHGIED